MGGRRATHSIEGRTDEMKLETLAVHAGYAPDPTTKAVAVRAITQPMWPVMPTKRAIA